MYAYVRKLSGHEFPWVVSGKGGEFLGSYPTREMARRVARLFRVGRIQEAESI